MVPWAQKAIIEKFKRDNDLSYEPNEILVSVGGKQSFFNLAQAFINPGDEVIIPAPYWVSYPDMVIIAEGVPVIVKCPSEQDFKITPQQLEDAITDKTKMLVLNSPSNPTGMIYTLDELKSLAEVLKSTHKSMLYQMICTSTFAGPVISSIIFWTRLLS